MKAGFVPPPASEPEVCKQEESLPAHRERGKNEVLKR